MSQMYIKTVNLSSTNNPMTWSEEELLKIREGNSIVGYLLFTKHNNIAMNLYLLPESKLYEEVLDTIVISLDALRSAFLQWIELLTIDAKSFQFRNPPLDLWLPTRLNWINALSVKIHQKYGTDVSDALSTAYMTILKLHSKGNIYIGNLQYLKIAIITAIKKEHYYMRNRLTGEHPAAIHLDADTDKVFNGAGDDGNLSFHDIITAPTWASEEEERYDEIWRNMKEDLKEDFSEREIEQICSGNVQMNIPLYRRLLKWRKTHSLEDYL